MTWRELSPERLFELKDALVIDVRSPCEHKAEYIPCSVNIPLLEDDERAIVGTIYAVEGEMVARRKALKIISPKIPDIVDKILELKKQGQHIVVHCWRGGLRSETVASFLTVVGIDCWRLTGGFKAWRKVVIDDFARDDYQISPVILHGRTGVGKSNILCELEKIGAQVLNLEELANHRGSVFGALGLAEQPTQKNFESELWLKLKSFRAGPVFMEAESKKIGRLTLPEFLNRAIASGQRILITGSVACRVERIVHEYAGKFSAETKAEAVKAMQNLKVRLGTKRVDEITAFGTDGKLDQAIEALLIEYYDPLYDGHIHKNSPFELTVDGDDAAEAARTIMQWSQKLLSEVHS